MRGWNGGEALFELSCSCSFFLTFFKAVCVSAFVCFVGCIKMTMDLPLCRVSREALPIMTGWHVLFFLFFFLSPFLGFPHNLVFE